MTRERLIVPKCLVHVLQSTPPITYQKMSFIITKSKEVFKMRAG